MSKFGLADKIKPKVSMDEFFSTQEMRDQNSISNKVHQIEITKLLIDVDYAWTVREESEEYAEILESIREIGIISPLTVVAAGEDEYRVVSGRRRKVIAEQLGLIAVPCIIIDTDDEYLIQKIRNDSNLKTRREILPSEKAKAYKLELEALKHQGKRISTSSQVETKLRTDEIIAQNHGDTRAQVDRYIRLNNLIPELLDLVDEKSLKMRPALELSFLPEDTQRKVYKQAFIENDYKPTYDMCHQLREREEKQQPIDDAHIGMIMEQPDENKIHKNMKVTLRIRKMLPSGVRNTVQQEEYIIQAIKFFQEHGGEYEGL